MAVWHPSAMKVPYSSAGSFVTAGAKLVWHTTETKSLPTYDGSAPHFTFNPRSGQLFQHIPVDEAAKSLEHPAGTVETNRAHAIQVELICYSDANIAKQVGGVAVDDLTAADYKRIAGLARWIEKNAGVARKSTVKFVHYPAPAYPRLSATEWGPYRGHLGHQHVPNNHHGDPSSLDIKQVLAVPVWVAVKDSKVFATGSLRQVTAWIRRHGGKVRRLKGVNIRRR